MRVPVTWLRSYCDPDLTTEEIAERLDLTGTELERIERVGVGDTANFVVGRVLSAEKHPDADRLTVCEVDDGSGEPRTIVCGAPNVAAGPDRGGGAARARSCPTAPSWARPSCAGCAPAG